MWRPLLYSPRGLLYAKSIELDELNAELHALKEDQAASLRWADDGWTNTASAP
jgi:hypothetical protein